MAGTSKSASGDGGGPDWLRKRRESEEKEEGCEEKKNKTKTKTKVLVPGWGNNSLSVNYRQSSEVVDGHDARVCYTACNFMYIPTLLLCTFICINDVWKRL